MLFRKPQFVILLVMTVFVMLACFRIIQAADKPFYPYIMAATTEDVDNFAKCLTSKGFELFTLNTCGYCTQQKEMFGSSLQYLIEHECPTDSECTSRDLPGFPQWILFNKTNGQRQVIGMLQGPLNFSELASESGCAAPGTVPSVTQSLTPKPTVPVVPEIAVNVTYDIFTHPQNYPDYIILDVRTPGEYSAGHIDGALNIDYYASDFSGRVNQLDKSKTYIVYCRTGVRSAYAANIMLSLGFTDVFSMTGGIEAWKTAGHPVTDPAAGNTTFSLVLNLHGLGYAGDNVAAGLPGNLSPQRTDRAVMLDFYGSDGQTLITTKQGSVIYNNADGTFKGNIDGAGVSAGNYFLKARVQQFLTKQYPGFLAVQNGQQLTLPAISMTAGDINSDNKLSILDYAVIVDCYSDLTAPKNCADAAKKQAADITDDGKVEQYDYNLFLRELSVLSGE